MADLRRDVVKYIRDKAKSKYDKGTECEICRETEPLDFHHYHSLAELLRKWMVGKDLLPENILEYRDDFIFEHQYELYEATATLCKTHHIKLHSVYGKNPNLGTAKKQQRWVSIQRDKHGVV